MSSYPMDAAHCALSYTDGKRSNKFYKLYLLINADGKSVVIRHYGAHGRSGDVVVKTYDTQRAGEKEYETLYNEKTRKGYSVETNDAKQIVDNNGLRKLLGVATFARVPASAMSHIDPDADVTGRREADPPRFDENGKFLDPKARTFSPQEIAEAKRKEEAERQAQLAAEAAEAAESYRKNKRFGMFG